MGFAGQDHGILRRVGEPLDPLEERASFGVGVLIGVDHVPAAAIDELGDAGDQAAPVGPGQEEADGLVRLGRHLFRVPGQILRTRRTPVVVAIGENPKDLFRALPDQVLRPFIFFPDLDNLGESFRSGHSSFTG